MVTAGMALLDALTRSRRLAHLREFRQRPSGADRGHRRGAAHATGRSPTVITCPNEMVALSCAHGFAQVSGRPQAVVVHVDCGTQALAGALHNAARGRVPVFIFAGLSPVTQEGEAARQPQRIHPLAAGRARPARHRPPIRQIRERDPHARQRQADRPPRPADRRTAIPRARSISSARARCWTARRRPVAIDRARWQPIGAAAAAGRGGGDAGRARSPAPIGRWW